jgi:hypothetical protein
MDGHKPIHCWRTSIVGKAVYVQKYMIWKIYSQIHISFCFTEVLPTEHVGVEVTLLIYIWEVLGSNLGRDTGIFRVFCDLPQSLQTNAWNISIRPQPLPSKSFPIQFLPMILRFDITMYEYNPESFVSALSSSKQHWPMVTCWPGELPVALSACTIPLESSGNKNIALLSDLQHAAFRIVTSMHACDCSLWRLT